MFTYKVIPIDLENWPETAACSLPMLLRSLPIPEWSEDSSLLARFTFSVTFQSTMRMCCSMWAISSQEVFQNRRILCSGTSTRSSALRPNPFLFCLGDGAGRTSGSPSPGRDFWTLEDFCPIFQRPLAWHSSSKRKQGDSWKVLIMWESSSCYCQPGHL